MIDPDNKHRAACAEVALSAFSAMTRVSLVGERDDAISDLICDLLHLARREEFDPEMMLERARSNFEAEEAEEA